MLAIYSAVVLLSVIVYFYRRLAKIYPFQRGTSTLSLVIEKTQSYHALGLFLFIVVLFLLDEGMRQF